MYSIDFFFYATKKLNNQQKCMFFFFFQYLSDFWDTLRILKSSWLNQKENELSFFLIFIYFFYLKEFKKKKISKHVPSVSNYRMDM